MFCQQQESTSLGVAVLEDGKLDANPPNPSPEPI